MLDSESGIWFKGKRSIACPHERFRSMAQCTPIHLVPYDTDFITADGHRLGVLCRFRSVTDWKSTSLAEKTLEALSGGVNEERLRLMSRRNAINKKKYPKH